MTIVGVPSALPPWTHGGPPSVIFYDPALTDGPDDIDLAALGETVAIPIRAGCEAPIWIPGDPEPTEDHYAEVLTINPALAGWGEPL